MTRSIPEWVGASDDVSIPNRVRLRIFERYDGVCYLSGVKIQPGDKWELEHIVALCNGGENREGNLAPALIAPHKAKTKLDLATKSKNDRVRKKHIGIRKPSRFPAARNSIWKKKMDGSVVRR